jgi:hypothetical protein
MFVGVPLLLEGSEGRGEEWEEKGERVVWADLAQENRRSDGRRANGSAQQQRLQRHFHRPQPLKQNTMSEQGGAKTKYFVGRSPGPQASAHPAQASSCRSPPQRPQSPHRVSSSDVTP